jgi:monothiol glutaredoxin
LRGAAADGVLFFVWGRGWAGTGLSPELRAALDEYVGKYKVVVFMKGTPQFPQCGFSNTVVQILNNLQAPFEGVNILEDDSLRGGLKEYSAWPTFPQIYIAGEFYGGCDIMIGEMNLTDTATLIASSPISPASILWTDVCVCVCDFVHRGVSERQSEGDTGAHTHGMRITSFFLDSHQ